MSELKTLQDLEVYYSDSKIAKGMSEECVSREDLKQDAINDIKYAQSSKDGANGLFGGGIDFMFTEYVTRYIKWKNNITEEDLK